LRIDRSAPQKHHDCKIASADAAISIKVAAPSRELALGRRWAPSAIAAILPARCNTVVFFRQHGDSFTQITGSASEIAAGDCCRSIDRVRRRHELACGRLHRGPESKVDGPAVASSAIALKNATKEFAGRVERAHATTLE